MAVKQEDDGKWRVQVKKKGMPRVRKAFPTEELARNFEKDYIERHQAKLDENTDDRSLMNLIDTWYRQHGNTLDDKSKRLSILENMAADLGNPIAKNLSASEFLDYRYRCTVTNKKTIETKTFNNRHSYLNAVFRRLFKYDMIDYLSPITKIDMIKIQERHMTYLSKSQIKTLFESLKMLQNKDVWWISQICIRTGARWGEAETLTAKQLHHNRVTYEFTKAKKIRTVQLDKQFYKDLKKYIGDKDPGQRIFKNGESSFRRGIGRTSIQLPRGQMTHVLRHSFASYFMINGGNILTLQRILGHADIKMTMKYAHLAPNYAEEAVKYNPMADA